MNNQITYDKLSRAATETGEAVYYHVSKTQLSIARHYGGMRINGKHYTYFPHLDALVSDKTLKMALRLLKEEAETDSKEPTSTQQELL